MIIEAWRLSKNQCTDDVTVYYYPEGQPNYTRNYEKSRVINIPN